MRTAAATKSPWETVKHVIDIEVLEDLNTSMMSSICTVNPNLRKIDEEAFTPQWISIGPIHFGKQHLKEMQKVKYICFQEFWKHLVSNGAEKFLNEYKHYLETRIQDIKKCYEHKFQEMSDETFVEIVLLDSVFIIQLFREEQIVGRKYALTNYVREGIKRDLLLLENQLPYWVLRDLYPKGQNPNLAKFVDLTYTYFSSLRMYVDYDGKDDEVLHFVDFVRRCCLFGVDLNREMLKEDTILQVSASKLYEAGVSFECVDKYDEYKTKRTDIRFETQKPFKGNLLCLGCFPSSCCQRFKARLVFPRLKLDNTTITILKNLMAFEQNHQVGKDKPFFTSYVSLLSSLVNTKEDAELLVERGCILPEQGSAEEVVNLVKGLSKHVVSSKTCHDIVIRELNNHCNSVWKKAMGTVRRVYFRDAWRGSSTLIGIVVLIFTIFGFYRDIRAFVLSS